jgi:hypothetical protein
MLLLLVLLLVIPPKQERRHDTYHALILIPATINTVAEQLALAIVGNVAPLWHQTQRTEEDKLWSLEQEATTFFDKDKVAASR